MKRKSNAASHILNPHCPLTWPYLRAAALVMAEIEREFEGSAEGSSSGHAGMRGFRGRPIGPGGGFVRAGGAPIGAPTSFAPPRGPAAMGYGRVSSAVTDQISG